MEKLLKMLHILSWIMVVGCGLTVIVKIYLQYHYTNSLEEKIDNMRGIQVNFLGGIWKLGIFFILGVVYLIVN